MSKPVCVGWLRSVEKEEYWQRKDLQHTEWIPGSFSFFIMSGSLVNVSMNQKT